MGMTDYPYPNIGYSGSGIISRANMAVPTSDAGLSATTRGLGMAPHTMVPLLPYQDFEARGRGVHNLDRPHVPETDPRFNRGPSLSGVRGTLDIWYKAVLPGTAYTLCYLTDDVVTPSKVLALRTDVSNRAVVTFTDSLGTTVGDVTPSYGSASVAASGVLTLTSNANNGDTVTIGGKLYTFETSLTDVDGHVLIDAGTASNTIDNFIAAITLGAGAGTAYATSMTANPYVTAVAGAGDTMDVTALSIGVAGNLIDTTETSTVMNWASTTLTGGTDGGYGIGSLVHARLVWDSTTPVNGTQYAKLTVNGEEAPAGDWSTDPSSAWASFQPTYLVVGQAYGGDVAPAPETIVLVQASNVVQP